MEYIGTDRELTAGDYEDFLGEYNLRSGDEWPDAVRKIVIDISTGGRGYEMKDLFEDHWYANESVFESMRNAIDIVMAPANELGTEVLFAVDAIWSMICDWSYNPINQTGASYSDYHAWEETVDYFKSELEEFRERCLVRYDTDVRDLLVYNGYVDYETAKHVVRTLVSGAEAGWYKGVCVDEFTVDTLLDIEKEGLLPENADLGPSAGDMVSGIARVISDTVDLAEMVRAGEIGERYMERLVGYDKEYYSDSIENATKNAVMEFIGRPEMGEIDANGLVVILEKEIVVSEKWPDYSINDRCDFYKKILESDKWFVPIVVKKHGDQAVLGCI